MLRNALSVIASVAIAFALSSHPVVHAAVRAGQAVGVKFLVNGFDEFGNPKGPIDITNCVNGVPGAKGDPGQNGTNGTNGTNGAPGGPGPQGLPGAPANIGDLVPLLAAMDPTTLAPALVSSMLPLATGVTGRGLILVGAHFTTDTAVSLSIVQADDAACTVNVHQVGASGSAWPNQEAQFGWSRALPGESVCLKVSTAATIGGSFTVLR
jgi:hypothetical protein